MTEAIVTLFRVGGMDCANCASKVENAVSRVSGVTEVGASFTAQAMTVAHTGVPIGAIRNAVKEDALLFVPGEGMAYSNIGFDLLAMALSERAGMPYADLLQETVLDPIGLARQGSFEGRKDRIGIGERFGTKPDGPPGKRVLSESLS